MIWILQLKLFIFQVYLETNECIVVYIICFHIIANSACGCSIIGGNFIFNLFK